MDQFGGKSKKKLNSAEFMEFVFSKSGLQTLVLSLAFKWPFTAADGVLESGVEWSGVMTVATSRLQVVAGTRAF